MKEKWRLKQLGSDQPLGCAQCSNNLNASRTRRRTQRKSRERSSSVGKTLVSGLKIVRTLHMEKKKLAIEVANASCLTLNGIITANMARPAKSVSAVS